jgi:outer membrane protein OmpA-like peptidoglycan-associated protein
MTMHLLEVRVGRYIALALALSAAAFALRSNSPRGRVVVTDTQTEILDVVEFAPGTAALKPSSLPTLDAVAATMLGNPSIELVEVQAHTSGTGDDAANLELSDRRATVVEAYLVQAGVEPARLESQGYGNTQPIERGVSAKNERISFLILQRSSDE